MIKIDALTVQFGGIKPLTRSTRNSSRRFAG